MVNCKVGSALISLTQYYVLWSIVYIIPVVSVLLVNPFLFNPYPGDDRSMKFGDESKITGDLSPASSMSSNHGMLVWKVLILSMIL